MSNAICVFLGGGLGSVARWLVTLWLPGASFPWGTLVVNVTGSLAIGALMAVGGPEGKWVNSGLGRDFFVLGVCGGYTTFSSFSLQTLRLLQEGQWLKAGANCVLSVVLCLAAVWLGHESAGWLSTARNR